VARMLGLDESLARRAEEMFRGQGPKAGAV